jgi:hypothetical protein
MSYLQFHGFDQNWVCQMKVMVAFPKLAKFCPIVENKHVENMLVVEPDYVPDSEVLAFNHVYTP